MWEAVFFWYIRKFLIRKTSSRPILERNVFLKHRRGRGKMNSIVMKFGGPAVATPEKITEVAQRAMEEKAFLTKLAANMAGIIIPAQ